MNLGPGGGAGAILLMVDGNPARKSPKDGHQPQLVTAGFLNHHFPNKHVDQSMTICIRI